MFSVDNPAVMEQKHVTMLRLLHLKLCGTKYKCEGLNSTWFVRSSTITSGELIRFVAVETWSIQQLNIVTQEPNDSKWRKNEGSIIKIVINYKSMHYFLVFVYLSLSLLVTSILLEVLQSDQCKFIQEQRNSNNNNIEIHHPYAQEGSSYKQPCSSARKWS